MTTVASSTIKVGGLRGATQYGLDGVDLNNVREPCSLCGSNWVNGAHTNFSWVVVQLLPNTAYVFQLQIVNTWGGTFAVYGRASSTNGWGTWNKLH